ncbi:MAG: UDP-galactopyranose mutase [Clostridia bacterium]|nr:UDP-galactopyranose mutase [Clostridia bacterium]
MYDVIVIGCGFAGAVAARKIAEERNKKVLVLEKRGHIGGNMYESADSNGISVHWYGPHIFHTNLENVFEYLKRFADWYKYEHEVLGKIDGQLVPVPFNFTSLEKLFPEQKADIIKHKLAEHFPCMQKVSVLDLTESKDSTIREFGQFVYSKVFVNYTAKQWGVPPEEVDRSVINRVPVILGYDSRYFQDSIQYMPYGGFTGIFENMLNHPNITVELNCDATKRLTIDVGNKITFFDGKPWDKPIIYTGPIDELLEYRFGKLPYRSLELVFEQHDVTAYQPVSVVNYPNEEEFTRITEFKHLTGQKVIAKTTILKEYPMQYDVNASRGNIPYYPIINEENAGLYQRYRGGIDSIKNIYLCGRLAEYRYYNMDAVIDRALVLSEGIEI